MASRLFDRREPTGNWLADHSLSLVLALIVAAHTAVSLWSGYQVWSAEDLPVPFRTWFVYEYNTSLVADAYGVLLIVLLSKWLRETGSAESN